MDDLYHSSPRQVLPRWRTLARTPGHELEASRQRSLIRPLPNNSNSRELAAWRKHHGAVEAAELLELAALGRDIDGAEEAAYWVLRNGATSRPGVTRLANVQLGIKPPIEDAIPINYLTNPGFLQLRIQRIKERLIESPRDAICRTDLARLYLLLGQREKAKDSIRVAAKLSPDNRFVLRSAAQLFATISEAEEGLDLLWRSDAVRTDPWVQAAEVALADAVDRSPRYGSKQLQALLNTKEVGLRYSELAAGLASLEWKSGVKRSKVKKLLRQSLSMPTENALAQVVWLENEIDVSLSTEKIIADTGSAHEARSRSAYENGDYAECSSSALKWFQDQPFSREAARDYAFVTGVHLNDYEKSLEVGRAALRLHPNDFTLVNGQLYASVMADRIEYADALYSRLLALRFDRDHLPFTHAAAGLIAFAEGRISDGREAYLEAINVARSLKKPQLVANAYIYWLEREALAGVMDKSELHDSIRELDVALASLPKHIVSYVSPTWHSKKSEIMGIIDKKENLVSRAIPLSNGRSITYTIPAKHVTEAMRLM